MNNLGKTPVTLLQECLISRKKVPCYEFIQKGGQSHNPEFLCRVTVDQDFAEGKGRSKQIAKHRAAQNMLVLLELIKPKTENSEFINIENSENYVGLLYEHCLAHFYPEPVYILKEEAGPPHDRTFKMECSVSQQHEFGINKTIKLAKQEAAFNMLQRLKELLSNKYTNAKAVTMLQECSSQRIKKKIPEKPLTDEEVTEKYSNLRSVPKTKKSEFYYKDHHNCYIALPESSKTLSSLLQDNSATPENSVDLINQIAKELEIKIRCTEGNTENGKPFFILVLELIPSVATLGYSKPEAAYKMINSLKFLCE